MNKFIIQTRKEDVVRDGIDVSKAIKRMLKPESQWENRLTEYDDIQDAKSNCEKLIRGSFYKAENIRILEVVCEFTSEIIVKTK